LQAVYDDWDRHQAQLSDALTYNRKLWTVFIDSALSTDNALPADLRQNIVNLGLFIMKQSMAILAEPQREALSALININRQIAAGLRGQA